MAGRIRDADIQLVRERVDIAEVIGERVTLRNAGGGNLKGLCPFHDERSPSFNVTPARGVYHCFGCGVGGDAITFLTELDGLTFVEAVERLAGRAGLKLTYEDIDGRPQRGPSGQPGLKQRLLDAHTAAAEFYTGKLLSPEALTARQFLTTRGFDREAAATFGCGYAPDGWDALTKHLRAKGFTAEELTTAGLAKPSRTGSLIDRFRRRLVWPIRDSSGSVIGFGARKLYDDDQGPKYLNTPETPLYKKSQVLYGIDLARKEIAKTGRVVIVEGYTDVMACHLAGVPMAVATCGTAFGPEHIRILRRFLFDSETADGRIIFTFDGDEAGQRAALKAFDEEQRFVSQTYIAVTPGGQDPCELRQSAGDVAVRELIERHTPLVQFALERAIAKHDLDTAEGRLHATRAIAPLLARVKDRGLVEEYLGVYAGRLGKDKAELRRAVQGATAGRQPEAPAGPRREPRADSTQLRAQREVLKVALQQPQIAGPYFDAVDATPYTDPNYRAVREAVEAAGGAAKAAAGANWIAAVQNACKEIAASALVSELAVEELRIAGEPDPLYVRTILARIQRPVVDAEVADLKRRLQRINPSTDKDEYMKLFGQLMGLEQHARSLRDQAANAVE
ncbi:DNA primase [Glycomyces sp. TRM65418]|uniref:DNA primase n=1 Tax=Glycomyces sp. TRM65418 TaxID=2867006 RepID=UPI001CE582C7|nr:DNA primase [Glycomyces sp. TRM65418]MCC3762334.1 DNA primase [Glycomyces sp. TRM65418]QZD56386.1 DNA primase [Glycomyces sp. TRM65418]